jgi:hypothetical protein
MPASNRSWFVTVKSNGASKQMVCIVVYCYLMIQKLITLIEVKYFSNISQRTTFLDPNLVEEANIRCFDIRHIAIIDDM